MRWAPIKPPHTAVERCCDFSLMSFGRPPSLSSTGFTATPPDRGSFPLDHYGAHVPSNLENPENGIHMWFVGECKDYMVKYLDCLKTNGSASTPCRVLGKDYLDCRMSRCAWLRLDLKWVADCLQGTHGT